MWIRVEVADETQWQLQIRHTSPQTRGGGFALAMGSASDRLRARFCFKFPLFRSCLLLLLVLYVFYLI